MILAELEIFHSRPIAPTRRVALGRATLPTHPAPGFGGILLGGIVAAHVGELDDDESADLARLVRDVDEGRRIAQPRLRNRYQTDRIGLTRSRHRLVASGEALDFDLDDRGRASQYVLGAVYAAGRLAVAPRHAVFGAIRAATRWRGPIGPALAAHLAGADDLTALGPRAVEDPLGWARSVLGVADNGVGRRQIQRRFRELLRDAHPDHGGRGADAAERIAELAEARRILLA